MSILSTLKKEHKILTHKIEDLKEEQRLSSENYNKAKRDRDFSNAVKEYQEFKTLEEEIMLNKDFLDSLQEEIEKAEEKAHIENSSNPHAPTKRGSDLTLSALTAANKARQKDWPSEQWSLGEWMCALSGEVGEAANIVKKIFRGDRSLDDAREDLGKELADIQTYLSIIADKAGIDLGQATISKFNEVSTRVGSDVFLPEDSNNNILLCVSCGKPFEIFILDGAETCQECDGDFNAALGMMNANELGYDWEGLEKPFSPRHEKGHGK